MKSINLLYLGYWSAHDSITHSTIFQHLEVLSGFDKVNKVIFCSIERHGEIQPVAIPIPKVSHRPLHSKNLPGKFITKWLDFFIFPRQLKSLIKKHNIHLTIGAGTQAGTLVLKAAKNTPAKVLVSFFDPHAQYMRALGIWKKYDPRYLYLNYWEKKLKKQADWLFPVSHAYRQTLLKEGIPDEKLFTVPCTVNLEKFKPDKEKGLAVRQKLDFSAEDTVGIYVGKFGDIYFDEEAFDWLAAVNKIIPQLKLIILTSQEKPRITAGLQRAGLAKNDYFIACVAHQEVPDYLNAADFAFSFIKPHPYSHAYSPIKHGEYWACGLSIVLPDHIGDDSAIIKKSGAGVVVKNLTKPETDLRKLPAVLQNKKPIFIRNLARQNRKPKLVGDIYTNILSGT
ncbi:MAG TPA: hypothetical protein ENJ39_08720 [Flammeovirgaceae bacterium]|nr:hypothetical protein [Flammeovirgaceae bacterium]